MEVLVENTALYEADRQLWLAHTVAQLQTQNLTDLDFGNLIEELESWGRREKQAIASYLMRLCEHLLKENWLTETFPRQYRNGRKLFLKASQLPTRLVATLEQALDEDWLPWQPEATPIMGYGM